MGGHSPQVSWEEGLARASLLGQRGLGEGVSGQERGCQGGREGACGSLGAAHWGLTAGSEPGWGLLLQVFIFF